MKRSVTITDILNSVEFELLQYTLTQDEVAQGIQRLRTYLAQTHSELFDSANKQSPTLSDITDLDLRTHEMMLTLIQTMNRRVDSLEYAMQRTISLQQHVQVVAPDQPEVKTKKLSDSTQIPNTDLPDIQIWENITPVFGGSHSQDQPTLAITSSMEDTTLTVDMDVRDSRIPWVGGLANRFRRNLHEAILFYIRKLSSRQTEVNQLYGDQILRLTLANQVQAAEIAQLREELQRLTRPPSEPPTT